MSQCTYIHVELYNCIDSVSSSVLLPPLYEHDVYLFSQISPWIKEQGAAVSPDSLQIPLRTLIIGRSYRMWRLLLVVPAQNYSYPNKVPKQTVADWTVRNEEALPSKTKRD
jgi:hypothetical protein